MIIELDGPIHNYQLERDAARDKLITSNGFTVLRFTNDELFNDISDVRDKILKSLSSEEREIRSR